MMKESLDQQADQAARAWEAEIGGWPGVAADQAFRAGWKAAPGQVREHIAAEIEAHRIEMLATVPEDLGPDQYEIGYNTGMLRAKLLARSSRPVVTETNNQGDAHE